MLKKYLDESLLRNSRFFICGPAEMGESLTEILKKMGVKRKQIRTERFSF